MQDLAMLRRLEKRILVNLPNEEARSHIIGRVSFSSCCNVIFLYFLNVTDIALFNFMHRILHSESY